MKYEEEQRALYVTLDAVITKRKSLLFDTRLIIGFSGTQLGMSDCQALLLRAAFWRMSFPLEFHHGDCVGADADAHGIAINMGVRVFVHPPRITNKRAYCQPADYVYPAKEYIERNHNIVDACDLLLAAPHTELEKLRSGTWSTVRYARKTYKPVIILRR